MRPRSGTPSLPPTWHAARSAGDSYGDVTVKAMAMAMEKFPKVDVYGAWTAPWRRSRDTRRRPRAFDYVMLRGPGDDGGEGGLRESGKAA